MAATAQAASEPEAIDDPIEAVQPSNKPQEPADQGNKPAAQQTIPEINAIAEATVPNEANTQIDSSRPSSALPTARTHGSLPFTGAYSSHLIQLILIGLVSILGGIVAIEWARIRVEAAR